MPRVKWSGKFYIVLFVCQSILNFNLHYIWQAYSTNDSLLNDTKVNDLVTLTLTLTLRNNFLGLCCRLGIVLHKFILIFSYKR